jgi:hypothetical protein
VLADLKPLVGTGRYSRAVHPILGRRSELIGNVVLISRGTGHDPATDPSI